MLPFRPFRPFARRASRLTLTVFGLCFVLLGVTREAASTPFPTPTSAAELACNLHRNVNPAEYREWWDAIPDSPTYRYWFWHRIVPARDAGFCAPEVQRTFWQEAVPQNWTFRPNIGGWPWASGGGYFTQTLWLRAIPDNWASVPNKGGWPWATGGYYTQTFWLEAVPDNWGPGGYRIGELSGQGYYRYWFWNGAVSNGWANRNYRLGTKDDVSYYRYWLWDRAVPQNWAMQPAEPGWRWSSGGYYTQAFWLHAVPENWASHTNHPLGRGDYETIGQGHYRHYFWEYAVPEGWAASRDRVEGWPWSTGGYYTQFFWWRAVPEDWVPDADQSIGGESGRGHYAFWLYHYAAPRGFAWQRGRSVRGSSGASYYMDWMHDILPPLHSEYAELKRLTSAHLERRRIERPVSEWFDPDAKSVVVLTFDAEGSEAQSCNVARILRDERVQATFMLEAAALDGSAARPGWADCLDDFDLGNHTYHHVGTTGFDFEPTDDKFLLNMISAPRQRADILQAQNRLGDVFGRQAKSFRAPWCDFHHSFDGSIIEALNSIRTGFASRYGPRAIQSDSSIATISAFARSKNLVPPVHLDDLSVDRFPYPFPLGPERDAVIEIPFVYPSDYAAQNEHNLIQGIPPNDSDERYMINVWKRIFDEIHEQNGVTVLLMHPWIQNDRTHLEALRHLIRYMKQPGVRFSTLTDVTERYEAAYE